MKRQHPYTPKCRCQRCQAVKKLVMPPKLPKLLSYTLSEINSLK